MLWSRYLTSSYSDISSTEWMYLHNKAQLFFRARQSNQKTVNSLKPADAYIYIFAPVQWSGLSLVSLIVFRLFVANSLPESMLNNYHHLDSRKYNSETVFFRKTYEHKASVKWQPFCSGPKMQSRDQPMYIYVAVGCLSMFMIFIWHFGISSNQFQNCDFTNAKQSLSWK